MPAGPRTYTGVLHVHTGRGGDAGTLEDIVQAARQTKTDFVVLTDHGTRGYGNEGVEGWHDGVLVLCGEEVRAPEAHLLAFETREDVGPVTTLAEANERLRRQVGVRVAIHQQLRESFGDRHPALAPALPLEDADLLEIWNFMDEFLVRTSAKYILQAAKKPEKLLQGPGRRMLWRWDRVLEKRRLPAVGGLNVTPRKSPLLDWTVLFPYDVAFRSLATCILSPELPAVSMRARDLVWSALREGRSFIVNRSLGEGQGFCFEYHPDMGRVRQMGEDVVYTREGRFFIRVPQEAEVVLRHNGQPLFWSTCTETSFCNAGPGSYRLEVYVNRRLWILSNPIRLIDDEGVLQPTVSDVT